MARSPTKPVKEKTDDHIQEVTQESNPNEKPMDVIPATDETASKTDATPQVIESPTDEKLRLAKELNLTVRINPQTGEPILPSTPALRAAAARKAMLVVQPTDAVDLEAHIKDKFGEKVSNDPNIKLVVNNLSEYVKIMGPKATISEEAGGEAQAKLANTYDIVLALEPDVAQIALSVIVTIIKQHLNGAFKETMALRYANTMPLNNELAVRFQLLTTLFITLAAGTSKKDLAKTINIRHLLEYISDRKAKANLSEFIN